MLKITVIVIKLRGQWLFCRGYTLFVNLAKYQVESKVKVMPESLKVALFSWNVNNNNNNFISGGRHLYNCS